MPRGDGTGPDGYGPMTGRALGYCAGFNAPGYVNGSGRGMGMGRGRAMGGGRGRGGGAGYGLGMAWRRGWGVPVYNAPVQGYPPQVDNVQVLKSQKAALEAQVESVKNALETISKKLEELENKE
ncbi:MAG: DUF5320 domain-containing protein [Promethearchaeota archaeon]